MTDDRTAPLRVLWVIKGLGPGGAEQLLVAHARCGDRGDRFRYEAAYLVPEKHHLVPALEEQGVAVTALDAPHEIDPRWALRLRRRLLDDPVDVVHVHSPYPAALLRPLVRTLPKAKRPAFVYTEHNRWSRYGRVTRLANQATYRLNDHVIAVSDDTRDSVPARLRDRVEVLEHGIDVAAVADQARHRDEVRRELGVEPHEILIGIVANFRPKKGYDVLLDAVARLDPDLPVRFVSIGQGPDEQELHERHRQLGLGDRFRFLGYRDDATRVMAGFDVFTLASLHEGLPVSLMEALALGLPVVATTAGGIPQAITDGKEGILVEPGDATALAEAYERMTKGPALRGQLTARARRAAARFHADRAVARLDELYRTLAPTR